MLRQSREADTGVKLEVNEKILDSCTELMKKIRVLIEKSKSLQNEIVAEGSVSICTFWSFCINNLVKWILYLYDAFP